MIETNVAVDGKNPAITSWYGKYPVILQGFIHPRWLFGISSINSIIAPEIG